MKSIQKGGLAALLLVPLLLAACATNAGRWTAGRTRWT
jgi:hypothetical protein